MFFMKSIHWPVCSSGRSELWVMTSKSSWEVLHQADMMFLELDNWTKLDQDLVPMTCFSDIQLCIHTQGGASQLCLLVSTPQQLCQNICTNPSETVVDEQGHHLACIYLFCTWCSYVSFWAQQGTAPQGWPTMGIQLDVEHPWCSYLNLPSGKLT